MKPEDKFHNKGYRDINRARWLHLGTLPIEFKNKTVLELGAGIGDHTILIEKLGASKIWATDARVENLEYMDGRFSNNNKVDVRYLDMDCTRDLHNRWHIIYCYGLLYHLKYPQMALQWMGRHCTEHLLLETAVLYEKPKENELIICDEDPGIPSHSPYGHACRPGRRWIISQLRNWFPFVYVLITQPDSIYYPLDWNQPSWSQRLARAVFIGSHKKIESDLLIEWLPYEQARC